jgi:hypothetical protein
MEEHLGYAKHAVEGRNLGNSQRTRSKTVITEIGPIEIDVPRDRDGTFDPLTVGKGQRRLEGVDAMVISLTPARSQRRHTRAGRARTPRWARSLASSDGCMTRRSVSTSRQPRGAPRWPIHWQAR